MSIKDYRSRAYRAHLSITSSNSVLTLNLTIPTQDHGSTLQIFMYKRIKVEDLTRDYIERIYKLQNAKGINVLETPKYFLIQYPGKSIVFLSKEDGKLYTLDDGFPVEEREKQAGFVTRMLHKFNLVEELHSKRIGRNLRNKERKL